jgi:hypothetical protein
MMGRFFIGFKWLSMQATADYPIALVLAAIKST